ncbi:MAG: DUF3431 domain-containing protein [Anaerolineales bacterium]|nr:DUF3431 domain-containing protein [Anaerolineales bacterium]
MVKLPINKIRRSIAYGLFPVNRESLSIVLSRYQEPTNWCYKLERFSKDIHIVDKMEALGINKGNESTSYLYYILQHYPDFNDFTLFTHCEERSWHYKFHLPLLLFYEVFVMNLLHVHAERPIYRNINWPRWNCRAGLSGIRTGSFSYVNPIPIVIGDKMNSDGKSIQTKFFREFLCRYIAPEYGNFFIDKFDNLSLNFMQGHKACACFFISRSAIIQHPKSFYQVLFDWVMETPLESYWSGRFFEYLWHIIFMDKNNPCINSA